jgi:hypothetical protein
LAGARPFDSHLTTTTSTLPGTNGAMLHANDDVRAGRGPGGLSTAIARLGTFVAGTWSCGRACCSLPSHHAQA